MHCKEHALYTRQLYSFLSLLTVRRTAKFALNAVYSDGYGQPGVLWL